MPEISTCDYYLLTQNRRGCDPANCDKYLPRSGRKKSRDFAKTSYLAAGVVSRLTEEQKSRAALLYEEGRMDSEIAEEIKAHPASVLKWRVITGRESNYAKLIKEAEEKECIDCQIDTNMS